MRMLQKLWDDDSAQDIVEYALIAGLISVVAVSIFQSMGGSFNLGWTRVTNGLPPAA
jgi:Flp pilus assembly pilin Flp